MMKGNNWIDISGQKFGRLTVLREAGRDKHGQTLWICKCDCGKETTVITQRLRSGGTKSCGCLKAEGNNKKHGMCYSRINSIYRKMKERCLQENNARFSDYGGRGISICEEWLGNNGFMNFYKWAMANGYADNLSIDRINNDGNYEPSNCRWVEARVQANNVRSNHLITYQNETHTIAEWSRIRGIPYQRLLQRINKLHWDVERALMEGMNGS